MHRSRLTSFLLIAVLLATSVTMTSCGGASGGTNPDLVLLGFNVPNLSGIPLNQRRHLRNRARPIGKKQTRALQLRNSNLQAMLQVPVVVLFGAS